MIIEDKVVRGVWLGEQSGKAAKVVQKDVRAGRRKLTELLHVLDKKDLVFYENTAMVGQCELEYFL